MKPKFRNYNWSLKRIVNVFQHQVKIQCELNIGMNVNTTLVTLMCKLRMLEKERKERNIFRGQKNHFA